MTAAETDGSISAGALNGDVVAATLNSWRSVSSARPARRSSASLGKASGARADQSRDTVSRRPSGLRAEASISILAESSALFTLTAAVSRRRVQRRRRFTCDSAYSNDGSRRKGSDSASSSRARRPRSHGEAWRTEVLTSGGSAARSSVS